MTMRRSPFALIKRVALPAVGLLIVANFLGYALVGTNGALAWGDYRRAKQERSVELARLEAERVRLQHRAQLLDPRRADPDLADELIRRELGLVRPDEIIIDMDRAPGATEAQPAAARPERR
ncbi:MAG: FtsB family cell division protein [Sphingosinicella sp.]